MTWWVLLENREMPAADGDDAKYVVAVEFVSRVRLECRIGSMSRRDRDVGV
jgi:hypothetical protein